jgi:hypothetical protein
MQTGNMKTGTSARFSYFNFQNSFDTAFNCHTPMDSVNRGNIPQFVAEQINLQGRFAFGNSFQNSSHCKTIPPDVIPNKQINQSAATSVEKFDRIQRVVDVCMIPFTL